jgi:hypothetical protein
MTLVAGTRLGPYETQAPLALAGGAKYIGSKRPS